MKERLPDWFKQKLPDPHMMLKMEGLISDLNLHTICQSAICPNIGQCYARETATFLILGDICTRNCTFCAVKKGIPSPVDEMEPQYLLDAVKKLNLSYVVVTSVTRDDLIDGGALQFVRVIKTLRENLDDIFIEVLVPDFLGSSQALKTIMDAEPDVLNHNIETVPRLYREVRPKANYSRSLELLATAKRLNPGIATKSGLMLGLGETRDEVIEVMQDLREVDCDLLTIGQYLQPSSGHHSIIRFVPPEEFSEYEQTGRDMGFADVASAPLVRSSYKAAELYSKVRQS